MNPPTLLPSPFDPDALWILDLSSWVRGAWESIKPAPPPDDLTDRSVVLAVVRRLAGLLGTERPANLVAAVDSRSPPWQAALWPSYKAGRKQPGAGYWEQLRVVRQVLDLHNIPSIEADGYQADDVIATITRKARAAEMRVVIITKDYDLWMLIEEDERVVAWGGGVDDPVIDLPAVAERYHGLHPSQLADMMALAGDGDEAPGVPRIGDKTAAELLKKRGSLAEVLRKWQWEKGKLSDALRDGGDLARLSRELVTLRDVPLAFELEAAAVGWTEHDAWKIRVMGEELGSDVMQTATAMEPAAKVQGGGT
jgi:5'-3' exonuclease